MKKKARFLCMILALSMILSLQPANPVSAANSKQTLSTETLIIYPTTDAKVKTVDTWFDNQEYYPYDYGYNKQYQLSIQLSATSTSKKLCAIKSSKPSVLSVNKKKSTLEYGHLVEICCTPKKAGTTKLTITTLEKDNTKKISTVTIKVKKYDYHSNPVKSLTLGKQTISGKKFNNSPVLRLKYKDYANKKLTLDLVLKGNCYTGDSITPIFLVTPNGSKYKTTLIGGSATFKITKKGSWIQIPVADSQPTYTANLTILFE